jgi:DNA repair photolyase
MNPKLSLKASPRFKPLKFQHPKPNSKLYIELKRNFRKNRFYSRVLSARLQIQRTIDWSASAKT